MRLPPSKQGKAGADFDLNGVFQDLQVRGGDVPDLVPVVHILSRSREDRLEEEEIEQGEKKKKTKNNDTGPL